MNISIGGGGGGGGVPPRPPMLVLNVYIFFILRPRNIFGEE